MLKLNFHCYLGYQIENIFPLLVLKYEEKDKQQEEEYYAHFGVINTKCNDKAL